MLKKIKRYLLLIPLLFVMMLNVSVYGQILTSSAAIDYNTLFHPFSESGLEDYYNITDSDAVMSKVHSSTGGYNYYVYALYATPGNYQNLLNGDDYTLNFTCVLFNDLSLITETDSFIYIQNGVQRIYYCSFISDFANSNHLFNNAAVDSHYEMGFSYNKLNGTFKTCWFFGGSMIDPNSSDGNHYFYQASNIPDFPFFYDFDSAASTLNVDVVFSPELTGTFNRTVSDRGQTVTLDDFSFKVSNNSKFDIQYLMAIYRESDAFLPFNIDPLVAKYDSNFNGKTYNGSPVYVYVKDEWLYLPHRQNGVITGYAPSSWHMVSSGDSDFVTINFNQVKLNTFQNYNVVVYAIRNDLSYVTPFTNLHEFQVPACADYNVELDTLQLVYSSQFSILNPAEFDATNNDNSYAFDEDDRLLFNRANGYIDENGEMVIDRVDTNQWVTEGSDDPWVNWDSDLNAWDTYYRNQNTVSSDIDQLSRNFSSFFKFVNKFFSYFPKNYQSIIILGLTSIVVLGIIKVII